MPVHCKNCDAGIPANRLLFCSRRCLEVYHARAARNRPGICSTCGCRAAVAGLKSCQSCREKRKKQYANSAPLRERHYFAGVKRKYGLTRERYYELFAFQKGCCAICDEKRPLVVDHDHATGRVRGLLCQICNRFLGKSGDRVAYFGNVIAYLLVHSGNLDLSRKHELMLRITTDALQ